MEMSHGVSRDYINYLWRCNLRREGSSWIRPQETTWHTSGISLGTFCVSASAKEKGHFLLTTQLWTSPLQYERAIYPHDGCMQNCENYLYTHYSSLGHLLKFCQDTVIHSEPKWWPNQPSGQPTKSESHTASGAKKWTMLGDEVLNVTFRLSDTEKSFGGNTFVAEHSVWWNNATN